MARERYLFIDRILSLSIGMELTMLEQGGEEEEVAEEIGLTVN